MTDKKAGYTASVALRARAEAVLRCPLCGSNGHLRRVGGGATGSTFLCRSRVYPGTCSFRFTVSDRLLDRVARP